MWDLISPPKILGAVCRKQKYTSLTCEDNTWISYFCGRQWGVGKSPGPYLLCELDDQRQLVGLDESQEVFFGQLSIEGIAPFVKL